MVSLAEFLATMRTWLDHHCIVLVDDLKPVTVTGREGVFDAEFDNPRDARLFGCRFANQPVPNPQDRTGLKSVPQRNSSARKLAKMIGAWAPAEAAAR